MDQKNFSFFKMFFVLGLALFLSLISPLFFRKGCERIAMAGQDNNFDQTPIGSDIKSIKLAGNSCCSCACGSCAAGPGSGRGGC